MTEDDGLLPLSGLQHLLFCERQCALIHVEGQWAENVLTVQGRQLHERVDRGGVAERKGVTVVRDLVLVSRRLGLIGRADVVEFRGLPAAGSAAFPVEYKRGRRKRWLHDEVQLCAQALCLEEMLGRSVPAGAIYYGSSRRRRDVEFDEALRDRTVAAARRFSDLWSQRVTPRAAPAPKCRSCSLRQVCQPEMTAVVGAASRYLTQLLRGEG